MRRRAGLRAIYEPRVSHLERGITECVENAERRALDGAWGRRELQKIELRDAGWEVEVLAAGESLARVKAKMDTLETRMRAIQTNGVASDGENDDHVGGFQGFLLSVIAALQRRLTSFEEFIGGVIVRSSLTSLGRAKTRSAPSPLTMPRSRSVAVGSEASVDLQSCSVGSEEFWGNLEELRNTTTIQGSRSRRM